MDVEIIGKTPLEQAEERIAAVAQERFRRASQALARTHDGPVEWPNNRVRGDMTGNGYFSSVSALIEACARNYVPLPAFVWPCASNGLSVDASDVIEHALVAGEHHEDAAEQLAGGAEESLQSLLDVWVHAYARDVRTWWPTHHTALVFDDEDRETLRRIEAAFHEQDALLDESEGGA